eukprot:1438960-Lingulodinium_polyedra.AAC.1
MLLKILTAVPGCPRRSHCGKRNAHGTGSRGSARAGRSRRVDRTALKRSRANEPPTTHART